ncbi:hypothetical protein ENFAE_03030 [Enterococcus faecalis]|nr:hypothetical protein ENFAE_03030 [Enterococcus faecalis]
MTNLTQTKTQPGRSSKATNEPTLVERLALQSKSTQQQALNVLNEQETFMLALLRERQRKTKNVMQRLDSTSVTALEKAMLNAESQRMRKWLIIPILSIAVSIAASASVLMLTSAKLAAIQADIQQAEITLQKQDQH